MPIPASRGGRALGALVLAAALTGAAAPAADDPLRGQQYGLDLTGLGSGDAGDVVVAVLDTGVDLDHPDLAGALVPGLDLVDGDGSPDDPNGHGTHVAGIVAARAGNGIGVTGAAPGALVMPVRVLDDEGGGSNAVAAQGLRWAVDNGAKVINLSLGEGGLGARLGAGGPLAVAIVDAVARGVVVIAAAGNDGGLALSFRVGVPLLVASAVDQAGAVASFSNFGDVREVAAPGVGIVSTVPTEPSTLFPEGTDGYEALDGTSMAAPHVAALAALLVARGASPVVVSDIISSTAVNSDDDPRLGAGIIDARAAVAELPTGSAPAAPPAEDGWPVYAGTAVLVLLVLRSLRNVLSPRRRETMPG